MKQVIRISAVALIIAGAIAGNSLPKTAAAAIIHQGNMPGPVPACNPFTQSCPATR